MRRLITRRVLSTALTVALALAAIGAHAQAPPAFDVLIRGGQVLDGTGAAAVAADIGIRGDRIAAIGPLGTATATRVIDAAGLVVTPCFIDLHTHSEMPLLADGTAQSMVRQGVTLNVMGESTSVAPRDGLTDPDSDGVTFDWTDFPGYFARLERQGISINAISHVSAQQVRRVVMGYDSRPPTQAEVARMTALVA